MQIHSSFILQLCRSSTLPAVGWLWATTEGKSPLRTGQRRDQGTRYCASKVHSPQAIPISHPKENNLAFSTWKISLILERSNTALVRRLFACLCGIPDLDVITISWWKLFGYSQVCHMLRNRPDTVNDEPEKQLRPNLNSYRENYLRLSSCLLLPSQTVVPFLVNGSSPSTKKKKKEKKEKKGAQTKILSHIKGCHFSKWVTGVARFTVEIFIFFNR